MNDDRTFERKNAIPLGVPGAPWPTMIRREEVAPGGKTVTTHELGVMEDADNPLTLHSAREYLEVIGLLYRGMPVRNMLPAFEFVINHTRLDNNNGVAYLQSDPGTGKSYLAIQVGKACDPRGPMVVDAGGKNLEFLLFQTVFDTEESRSLTQAIDDGLQQGKLNELSIKALRKLNKNFDEKKGTGRYFSEDKTGRKCVDWNGVSEDEKLSPEEIQVVLEGIRTIEGWDAKSMGVGFKTKEGPLVKADKEGRILVVDELDKCKLGSEAPLQIVWQVKNGETAEHTVPLGNIGTYTFKRGQGCKIICTGNLPKDGAASHLISESFDRRVPAYRIPNFTADDWADRTSQVLTGLPIPILHHMMPGDWKKPAGGKSGDKEWVVKNPDEFTKLLLSLSTLGMTTEEHRQVKEWQISQIPNWKNVLEVSKKLGEFYYKWSQLVDPDSELMKSGKFADILLEIDNPQNPTAKVTPSHMIRHIEDSLIINPQKREVGKGSGFDLSRDWSVPTQANASMKEPVEINMGTRLVKAVMDEVYRSTAQEGKKHLYAQLMEDAKEAGLIGNPPPLATLLNVDPSKQRGSAAQAKRAQSNHASLLRATYPDLGLSMNDEEILPLRFVQAALEQIDKTKVPSKISPFTTVLQAPSTDLDTVQQKLFTPVVADNKDPEESLDEAKKRLPAKSLLNVQNFLYSITMPVVGANNLKALWNEAHTKGAFVRSEATAIGQAQSSSGVAITSVLVQNADAKGKPAYAPMHLLRNDKLKRTVIIGDETIDDELYNRLKRSNIVYINRSHEAGPSRIPSELQIMMEAGMEEDVKEAFLLRNKVKSSKVETASLAKLLSDPGLTEISEPNFVTALDPKDVSHAERSKSGAAKKRTLGGLLD
jgi:hypothetical protein